MNQAQLEILMFNLVLLRDPRCPDQAHQASYCVGFISSARLAGEITPDVHERLYLLIANARIQSRAKQPFPFVAAAEWLPF